jgi:23S rRNA (guanosine2251-2'-O)-methyltransferase
VKPEQNKELVFGIRPVIEALQSGKDVEKILVQRDLSGSLLTELLQLASKIRVPVLKVPIEKLNSITRKNHQGVVAHISPIIYASIDNILSETFGQGKTPLLLILDRVTDVRNFGAIARTAECLGVNGIIIPSRGSAEINSDALKTSAGALNYIPVCREDNLKITIDYLKESGLRIVGCTEKADKLVYQTDLTGPLAIIMGSEENGISGEYLKKTDEKVKIPQAGKVESLNVSVATGIILSEVVRQRLG